MQTRHHSITVNTKVFMYRYISDQFLQVFTNTSNYFCSQIFMFGFNLQFCIQIHVPFMHMFLSKLPKKTKFSPIRGVIKMLLQPLWPSYMCILHTQHDQVLCVPVLDMSVHGHMQSCKFPMHMYRYMKQIASGYSSVQVRCVRCFLQLLFTKN